MKCIICKGEVIQFSQSSYMGLPTYLCKNCQLYVTGNSEFEIRQKSDLLYKEEYWTRLKSEESLLSNFKNIDSQGKRRQWISQYSYTKKYLETVGMIINIGGFNNYIPTRDGEYEIKISNVDKETSIVSYVVNKRGERWRNTKPRKTDIEDLLNFLNQKSLFDPLSERKSTSLKGGL